MAENNQKIPPLLPLEYCTVERAARLLGCEVEDIYHWQEIGAIKTWLNCPTMGGHEQVQVVLTDEYGNLADYSEVKENLHGLKNDPKGIDFDDLSAALSVEWKYSSLFMWTKELELKLDVMLFDGVDATVSGIWPVKSPRFDTLCSPEPKAFSIGEKTFYMSVEFSLDRPFGHWEKGRYLIGEDLLRLYKSIQTGTPLPNRYNNPDIDQKMREQEHGKGVLFEEFKTGQDTRGIALGVMAKLLAESKGRKFKRGENVNASALMTIINQECGCLGIEDLSEEVRKDISQCVSVITRLIEQQKK